MEASLHDEPLSLDRRERVIAAIDAGMSCRAAAARFGIAPSAAVKWPRWLETGSVAPLAQGGDTRSGRIEACGAAILALVETTPTSLWPTSLWPTSLWPRSRNGWSGSMANASPPRRCTASSAAMV